MGAWCSFRDGVGFLTRKTHVPGPPSLFAQLMGGAHIILTAPVALCSVAPWPGPLGPPPESGLHQPDLARTPPVRRPLPSSIDINNGRYGKFRLGVPMALFRWLSPFVMIAAFMKSMSPAALEEANPQNHLGGRAALPPTMPSVHPWPLVISPGVFSAPPILWFFLLP